MPNAEKEPGCVFCGAPGLRCCSTHKATVCQRCYDVVTEHFLVPTREAQEARLRSNLPGLVATVSTHG